jgi:hypothetical protein
MGFAGLIDERFDMSSDAYPNEHNRIAKTTDGDGDERTFGNPEARGSTWTDGCSSRPMAVRKRD